MEEARGYTLHAVEAIEVSALIDTGQWLREPARMRLTVTLEGGIEVGTEISFEGRTAMGRTARETEALFEIQHGGNFAFRGAVARRTWDFYAGADYSIRVINYLPGEESIVRGVRIEWELPVGPDATYCIKQLARVAEKGDMQDAHYPSGTKPFSARSLTPARFA